MREATLATAHDFTLDELQAYDEGTLAPERAAVVAAHLTAGCAACRAWIATSHEVGRLLHADAGVHLDGPDAFLLNTPPRPRPALAAPAFAPPAVCGAARRPAAQRAPGAPPVPHTAGLGGARERGRILSGADRGHTALRLRAPLLAGAAGAGPEGRAGPLRTGPGTGVRRGGAQNFTVDRAAAEHVLDNYPDAALAARSNRAFLRRAVAYLAGQGIAQFLDIGSGLPTVGNVHEVARQVNPRARIVYVDNDPVAVRYSRELLAEEGEGARGVAAIEADLRDPAAILAHPRARRLLDLSRPVALILAAVLHFIPDDDAALGAVRDLAAALPVGSYLVISHGTYDGASSETLAQLARLYEATTHPLGFRSHAQLARFFDGFEVIAPGIVFAPAWRPDGSPSPFTAEPERAAVLAGVGRKL